jgi:hypothetical protein
MPVSPQDFALWSDLTGNAYPSTPAERMALAPEVYQFTRNIGRRGGTQMSPLRQVVDVVGKAALAAGALAGAAYLGAEGYKRLNLDDEPGVPSSPEPVANPAAVQPADITPPTTAERYGQDVVPHQTGMMQSLRGTTPEKPTVVSSEEKTATQSHVIAASQTFSPGTELEQLTANAVPQTPVRDRADDLIAEFLGGVAAEQRQQAKIDQSVAEYAAGVAGKGERVLKQVLKEGREEGISPVGMKSVREASAFRQTPEYLTMMRGAGASLEPDELVGAPGSEVVLSNVRPIPSTRVSDAETVEVSSPIAEMATPAKVVVREEPVAVAVKATPTVVESASPETIELARKAFSHLPLEQAVSLLTRKSEGAPVVTAQPSEVRVAKEGRISSNEFLSAMSQKEGPLASYTIPSERSKAVSGMTFYPGGEIGVEMKTRGKPVEYAYAAADPYRLAMRDYAEEGFPASMGSVAGIAANQALAHQMGLQKAVERGGAIRGKRQPVYAGLMSDADISSAAMGKVARAKEQAERHFETKQIMQELEQRAAARRAGLL